MYQRKLKVHLLVIISLLLVACQEAEVVKGEYLKKGISLFEQQKFKSSKLEIKNAIQEDPTVANAYYYMALLNEKDKKYKAMRKNLLESVQLNPENDKFRLKLGKLHLLFGDEEKSLAEANVILARNIEDLDAMTLKASIYLRQKKTDEAIRIIDAVINKEAMHIDAVSLKIIVLMKSKHFEEALTVLSPALNANNENLSLHLLKLKLDSLLGDIEVLVKDYERLVELKPDNIKFKYALAQVYLQAKKIDQGKALLTTLVNQDVGAVEPEIALVNYLYLVNAEDGLNKLATFVEVNEDNVSSLLIYAKWLLSKNEKSRAIKLLNNISKQETDDKGSDEANLILAKLEMRNKSFDSAQTYLNKINVDGDYYLDANLLKATILLTKEQYSEAITIVEKILWQKPRMADALSLLGSIYLIQGDLDKAYANYKEALKISPKNLAALNYIVAKEIREEHVDYAIELLELALKYMPSQLNIMNQLVELYAKQKQWGQVEEYIERISTHKNGEVLSSYLSAKVFYKKEEYKKAIIAYQALLEKSPWVRDALVDLSQCYSILKKTTQLSDYLDGFIKNNPNVITSYLLKSRLFSQSKQYQKAIDFIGDSLRNNALNSGFLYLELSKLYALIKDNDAEFKVYGEGLKNNPKHIGLLLQFANFHEKNNAFDKAVEQYNKILAIDFKHNIAKNNLATIYLDHYADDKHVQLSLELTNFFKQSLNPYYLDTYGWGLLKNKEIESAITVLKKVVIIDPYTAVFRYHLGEAFFQSGDKFSSTSELKQALQLGKGKVFLEREKVEKLLSEIK